MWLEANKLNSLSNPASLNPCFKNRPPTLLQLNRQGLDLAQKIYHMRVQIQQKILYIYNRKYCTNTIVVCCGAVNRGGTAISHNLSTRWETFVFLIDTFPNRSNGKFQSSPAETPQYLFKCISSCICSTVSTFTF